MFFSLLSHVRKAHLLVLASSLWLAVPALLCAEPAATSAPGDKKLSSPALRPPESGDDGFTPELVATIPGTPPPTPPLPTAPTMTNLPAPTTSPTQNVVINLVNKLVQKGLLSQDDASDLIKQSEAEAQAAKAQAAATESTAQAAALTAQAAADKAALAVPATPVNPNPDDDVRVTYVPEVVKEQMRDEIKADVLKQARDENWAKPNTFPEWVSRFKLKADIRLRYEGDFYPSGNATGSLVNFNAINTGSPVNTKTSAGLVNFPVYNVDQNRNRYRLRVRFGTDVDLGQGFSASIRAGTGADNQPVSQNQTLGGVGGAAGGQGSNFSQYSIWLDRGYLRYDFADDRDSLAFSVGRFDNPFFSSSLIWYNELAFDGAALQAKYKINDDLRLFGTAGAFPTYNTDLNFGTSSNGGPAYQSNDKYLFGGQVGLVWKITKDISYKGAVAFYDFYNIEGQISSPISSSIFASGSYGTSFQGNTDNSRPLFAQRGNTYIALRDINQVAATDPNYQYFGLATPFKELALTQQLDFSYFDPFHISLLGEFVQNVGFGRVSIENNGPSNFFGPANNNSSSGEFLGGSTGYNLNLTLGAVALEKFGDWNISTYYRYIESDAVVDAFNDPDFGGGGTNLKGYSIGGNLALTPRIWTSLRWYSAENIVGPTLKADTIQIDLNAKF